MSGKSKLKRLNKRKKNKKQFIDNVECINTSMIKHRPTFRGYVHALGLLITIGILIIILPHLNLFSEVTNNDSYVLLYFLIQILQFGLL
ncbi:hypothetical protein A0H76_1596 [Hepatospora eriocheir]|uniref:Uncharacterized protein n=1 Tax=Hepatospora eriocheir TaxID=1081669 RepID=A0A1X0Q5Q0_9MICR|nr:hypothetical protein A0H76_1596 [Hepatospora eriocheir]